MIEITREMAVKLERSGFWKEMPYRHRALFQLRSKYLCMPFAVFHEAVEKSLGRHVQVHELGLDERILLEELNGNKEIVDLVPEDSRCYFVSAD